MSHKPHFDIAKAINTGETLEIEFKDDSRDFSDRIIYEAVVAMTNTRGGYILVGVTDSGKLVGSRRFGREWASTDGIQGKILANTVPACPTAVSAETLDGKTIVAIRVPEAATTVGTKTGKFLKRVLDTHGRPSNVPMSADEIISKTSRVGANDFSAVVLADSDLSQIDLELVAYTAKQRATQVNDPGKKELMSHAPEDILSSLGLLRATDLKPNIACLLLFGKAPVIRQCLPNHEVQYQVFGQKGELLKNESYRGPIAAMFSQLLLLPELLRNSDEFRFSGSAVTIPEYPLNSRREAIANAIVHRDYSSQAGIQIQLYEKELAITNPGSFPQGVNIYNLLTVHPTPRNRRLAEAMREFGFVESSGRGIDYIFEGQARYGRPAPDYSASNSDYVLVRLAGGKANLDFCRFILSTAKDPEITEVLLLNAMFFKRQITLEEAARTIHKSPTVTHEILFGMHKEGFIEVTAEAEPRFLLKGSLHHSARNAIKPQRLSKAEFSKYEDRLIAELQRRSPNSLSNLADLVGLSPPQTRRMLGRLKEQGRVDLLPNKRWALGKKSKTKP